MQREVYSRAAPEGQGARSRSSIRICFVRWTWQQFRLARTKSRELFRFLQVFQPRLRFLASRVELQSSAVLFGRFGAFALRLVKTPEPLARGSMRRPIAAVGRAGEVRLQILFGMRRIDR